MISEILMEGEENALTGRSICSILGINLRGLQAAVEAERRAGKPICASCGSSSGYYLASNRDEMEAYCRSLERREKEISKTRRACRKSIADLPECKG